MYFSVKFFEIFKNTFFTEHKFERLLRYITIIIYEYLIQWSFVLFITKCSQSDVLLWNINPENYMKLNFKERSTCFSSFYSVVKNGQNHKLGIHWRPFNLMFYSKRFGMLSHFIGTVYNQKIISYSFVLGQ